MSRTSHNRKKVKPGERQFFVASIALMFMASFALAMGLFTPAQASDSTFVDVPAIPSGVTSEDPCGPDNAYWTGIPADADFDAYDFKFDNSSPMHLIVVYTDYPIDGKTFPNGTDTYDYGLPTDSGEACAPETQVIDVPDTPSVTDPCNPAGVDNNATWNVPDSTDTLHWAVNDNDHLVVTIVADNTTFPDESTTHDYGVAEDSGKACDDGNPTPGDNGDVKTHNVGTSTDDTRNEPKVSCKGFYLDGFNFDGLQEISWWITEGPHGDTVLDGTITLDEDGHGYTDTLVLPNGQYKLYWTWDGKKGAPKHKVFKVKGNCEEPPPPTVIDVPAQPSVNDPCGPRNASWNVPTDDEVLHWGVDEEGHLIVSIVADNTTFPDESTTHDYGVAPDSNTPCPPEVKTVTPVGPMTSTPSCDNVSMTVTPSSQEGVIWTPSGATVLKPGDSVTYTATAQQNYTFPENAQTSWTITNTFSEVCLGPPPVNPTPVTPAPHPKPKPKHLPETGYTSPSSSSNNGLWFLVAGLCAMLSLGSAGQGVAVIRRRRDGEG